MHKIMNHSDNIMEGLQKKIALKQILMDNKYSIPKKIAKTKTSELRSKSVLAAKTLQDINRSFDY